MAELTGISDLARAKMREILILAVDQYVITAFEASKRPPAIANEVMDEVDADFIRIMKSVRAVATMAGAAGVEDENEGDPQ